MFFYERKIIFSSPAQRYYSTEEDFREFHHNLKQIPCPHCGLIGALILHDCLYGYDEGLENKMIVRGRRIFCNSRKVRNTGCGRTFCILSATVLKTFSIHTYSLWRFLERIVTLPDRLPSFRMLKSTFHESAAYRLWKRFERGLTRIRSLLAQQCPRPKLTNAACAATQTIAHLKSIFKGTSCPIAAFQQRFSVSFL